MTVTITQDLADIAGVADNDTFVFRSPVTRLAEDGTTVIGTRPKRVTPVAGVLTVELEPGPCQVSWNRGIDSLNITIPGTDSDLWTLIAGAIGMPPGTTQQAIASAVADYLITHSIDEYHEYANFAAFPGTGVTDRIYVALDTGQFFRWTGSAYTEESIGQLPLAATAVKTSGYTAAISDLIPADATSAAFTVTLPSAPADKARVVVKKIDTSTNAVTVTAGGSDVFNASGGATSLTLALQFQAVQLQYKASGAIWYVVSTDVPLGGLDARHAFTRTGYGVVALGDSITANYGDQNQLREMEGPLSRACAEAGQNPLFRGTFATGGYTLAQILSTHVPTVVALSPKPWAAVILGGTNDAGASSGVGFSVSTAIGTLTSICNALRAANIQPILATLTPRSDTSLVNQNVGNYNRALWRFALANGYDVVDYNKVVVNPATGGFLTGYAQSDNIHPDFKAVKIMGTELARVFDGMQKPSVAPTRATHSADPTNLLGAQGHFQVDTNADGIADGWSNAVPRGATFTVVSDPDGVTKWQRITQPSSATGNNLLQKSISSVVAVGDIIEAVCRIQTSGFDNALVAPSGLTGGTGPQFTFSVGLTGATHDLEPAYNWHTDLTDGLVYLRGVVPSGATGGITINLQASGVPVSGSVWMQYTEVCVRNLTTLGLV